MGMYVCMYVILIEQLERAVSQQKSKACTDGEAGINSGLQIWHSFLKISICWPGENNALFLLLRACVLYFFWRCS
jgi:hypothetical protein